MPLVPCPECKKLVSPAATSCPHCGFPFGGATLPAGVFPGARAGQGGAAPALEETLWEGRPSLKTLAASMAATAAFALFVPILAYNAYGPLRNLIAGASPDAADLVARQDDNARTILILVVVALVLARVAQTAWQLLALHSHRYKISNQRILVESGVLSKSIAEVDVRTIDDITFRQTFLERLSGIGQIAILTSEPSNPRLRLVGVPNPREIRELVRNSAYQATRGQLFTRST
jgi:membrane protein YdbS with pleckstrin-like domain